MWDSILFELFFWNNSGGQCTCTCIYLIWNKVHYYIYWRLHHLATSTEWSSNLPHRLSGVLWLYATVSDWVEYNTIIPRHFYQQNQHAMSFTINSPLKLPTVFNYLEIIHIIDFYIKWSSCVFKMKWNAISSFTHIFCFCSIQ